MLAYAREQISTEPQIAETIGTENADNLYATTEDELLRGLDGNDAYHYRMAHLGEDGSFGDDVIDDTGGNDRIDFRNVALKIHEVQVARDGADAVLTSHFGTVRLRGQFEDAGPAIERFQFDGVTRAADWLQEALDAGGSLPDPDAQSEPEPEPEQPTRNLVEGGAGSDNINQTAADDDLRGGAGADNYWFRGGAYGDDVIVEKGGIRGESDRLWFREHGSDDLDFARDGDDLVITVEGRGSVTVRDQFGEDDAVKIERIEFEDRNGAAKGNIYSTNANEILAGFDENDSYHYRQADPFGDDVIRDTGGWDRIDFRTSLRDALEFTFEQDGDDLILTHEDDGVVRVENHFAADASGRIERFQFADGDLSTAQIADRTTQLDQLLSDTTANVA